MQPLGLSIVDCRLNDCPINNHQSSIINPKIPKSEFRNPNSDALARVLLQEIAQLEMLANLLSAEGIILTAPVPEELLENVKKQEAVIKKLKALGETITALLASIAACHRATHLKPDGNELSLRFLSSLVEEPYATEYQRFGEKIAAISDIIDGLNRRNAHLLDGALDFVNCNIKHIASFVHSTYERKGIRKWEFGSGNYCRLS